MLFAEHASRARGWAKARGLADCTHYAENRNSRADALYALANASGIKWWEGDCGPALLPDGRMVVISPLVSFVELPRGRQAPRPDASYDDRLASVDAR